MKSRLAIGAMLVAGFIVSGTGGALAISGSSGQVSAAQAQYCGSGSTSTDSCGTTVEAQGNPNPSPTVEGQTESTPTNTVDATDDTPTAAAQPAAQVASDSNGNLPFTGYAAIPVILVGLALVAAGAFLRRESRRQVN